MLLNRLARNSVCAAAIVAGLALGCPTAALADTASDLEAARASLEEIGTNIEALAGDLDSLATELDNTDYEIMVKDQRLSENRATLASYVSEEYKDGGVTLLKLILGSSSIDDVITRVHYAQKISDAQASTIAEIDQAKTELEERKAYQQGMVDDTQSKLDALNEQRESAAALVNSLSSEAKAQLEEEAKQNTTLSVAIEQSKQATTTTTAADAAAAREASESVKQDSKQEASSSTTTTESSAGDSSGGSDSSHSGSTSADNSHNGTTQLPDTSTGGYSDYSSRTPDSSLYNVTWSGDSEYINALANKASQVGSSTNYFFAWDNELCRVIVFQRSGGGWSAVKLWNCNGARNTYSGAWTVVHKQICNWADEYFGQGYNDWSTCFIEAYSDSSLGHLRYIEGRGYEDCASIHSTGYSETGWGNTGCCGLTWDNAKWVYDNLPTGSTVYVFRYSDGRVF